MPHYPCECSCGCNRTVGVGPDGAYCTRCTLAYQNSSGDEWMHAPPHDPRYAQARAIARLLNAARKVKPFWLDILLESYSARFAEGPRSSVVELIGALSQLHAAELHTAEATPAPEPAPDPA